MGTVKLTEGRLEHVRTHIVVLFSLPRFRFLFPLAHCTTLPTHTRLRFAPWPALVAAGEPPGEQELSKLLQWTDLE